MITLFFHKVSQEEITKAKNTGNLKLFEKLCNKFNKQHKTPKYKRFYDWLVKHSVIISMILSLGAFITSIIAIFK